MVAGSGNTLALPGGDTSATDFTVPAPALAATPEPAEASELAENRGTSPGVLSRKDSLMANIRSTP